MLNVYVPPPATGRLHDTMHHRTTRPAAHAPLSTCQGPDPGTTPPLLTSGAGRLTMRVLVAAATR